MRTFANRFIHAYSTVCDATKLAYVICHIDNLSLHW